VKRYWQFGLVLLAAGTIYPLLYLRQNFETSLLECLLISKGQLGVLYSLLGAVFCLTYVPSGWLADRFSPHRLITLSLVAVGALGLWFSTFPPYGALVAIFIAWGLFTGLTFWASLIKSVTQLAAEDEQGRFFGFLDGGRGLVEAVLASVALSIFVVLLNQGAGSQAALRAVIYLYCGACFGVAGLVGVFLRSDPARSIRSAVATPPSDLLADLLFLFRLPQIWLIALIIFCGYQVFWSTYAFSAFLQEAQGMTATTAGLITVTKLWMRPIGGIGGGFLGDRLSNTGVLSACLFLSAVALGGLAFFAQTPRPVMLFSVVLFVGLLVYAIRGLYWAIFHNCAVPARLTGLAIGLVSMMGYLPDILSPLIHGQIMTRFPGTRGYQIYFFYIACCGLVGAIAAQSRYVRATPRRNA
jgi:sugar phosphate permease